ncbi:MAG: rhodanese-related sulfurtransferase [Gammaproteobacteria bacterium]|nr:rhodanese-related sulfurtransferase [Gammaproteobacteria bacterium]
MSQYTVLTFYKFIRLEDCAQLRAPLLEVCQVHGVIGTILLAPEGINATIAGTRGGVDAVLAFLRADPRLADVHYKASAAREPPFGRMKVRLKKEIVTLGVDGVDPARAVGEYVPASQWNSLLAEEDMLVLDTRNVYETALGVFEHAVDPRIATFRQFPDYVRRTLDPATQRNVAMYCTGGIRCEKASALLLDLGFKNVYHLQGGILKYLEHIPAADSVWRGSCFVFDERVALGQGLVEAPIVDSY